MKSWLYEVVKVSNNIKPSTFARYEGIYRNYFQNSDLASIKIDKIKPLEIQRHYNKLLKDKKSSNAINNANKLLKQFFNYCVDSNYILKNPCDGKKVVIPKDSITRREEKTIPIFSNDEMKLILNQDENTKIRYVALISYATGMRKGEILGLSENDLDYKNKIIQIRRTSVTTYIYDDKGNKHKETFLNDTKTLTSYRSIPMPESLKPILEAAMEIKKQEMIKAGDSYNKDNKDLIFLTEHGELLEASNIDKSWIYFLKRCKVEHKKFHALRHTYATLQFENDRPLLTISKLLGHASIDVTANTYTHVVKKEKEKAIDTLSLLK